MSQSDFMQMNLFSEDQDTAGILLSCASDSPLSCDKDPRPPITVTWNLWHGCKKVSPGCHTQAVPQGGVGRRGRQERSRHFFNHIWGPRPGLPPHQDAGYL